MLRVKKDMMNKEKYFGRFLVLFDAVVAIILTIIVLTIKVPNNVDRVDIKFLFSIGVTLSCYAISFYIVATFWEMHHRIIESVVGASRRFVYYNFLFLFILSLFPVACIFMNEAVVERIEGLSRFAFVFYMSVNLLASMIQVRIMYYIRKKNKKLIFDEEKQNDVSLIAGQEYYHHAKLKMALNILPLIVAFFFPAHTFLVYIGVAVITSFSLRRVNKTA